MYAYYSTQWNLSKFTADAYRRDIPPDRILHRYIDGATAGFGTARLCDTDNQELLYHARPVS